MQTWSWTDSNREQGTQVLHMYSKTCNLKNAAIKKVAVEAYSRMIKTATSVAAFPILECMGLNSLHLHRSFRQREQVGIGISVLMTISAAERYWVFDPLSI